MADAAPYAAATNERGVSFSAQVSLPTMSPSPTPLDGTSLEVESGAPTSNDTLSPTPPPKRVPSFDSTLLRHQQHLEDISTDLPKMEPQLARFEQPRGGVVVETKLGNLQFGMPPETIKDCLASGLMVPQYFVVPTVSFVRQLGPNIGINVAEFEFPTYCNFFFYRRRVTLIVASKEIEERIRSVFQETLFGPNEINLAQDFPAGTLAKDMPDLRKELDYFRVFDGRLMQLEDLLEFIVFNEDGVATITGKQGEDEAIPPPEVTLQWRTKGEHDDGEYVIIQDDLNAGTVSDQVVLPLMEIPPSVSQHVFEPPLFGVTVLGNSHGFDPVGKTSGYVLWLSRRGYMIDPPPQSTALLLAQNIPPSLITGVIITHCHADHDAGTFQKILQEGRITLMTTRTIHDSFLRKYAALSGLDPAMLSKSFHFRPVKIGESIKMRGGKFKFFYSLHAIPCVGFEVFLGDKSMVFSGDHMNDPPKIKELHAQGVLTDWRCNQLLNFPWERDIILHEAGIPPIHTPMTTLSALPDDVKKRLYVVHVGANSFKPEYGLKPAPVGVENTLTLEVEQPENAAALEVLDLVTNIDLFSALTIQHAREILQIADLVHYKAGDYVIRQGEEGHNMMIIASGKADVVIKVQNRDERIKERKESEPSLGADALISEGDEDEEEEDDDEDDEDVMMKDALIDDSPTNRMVSLNGSMSSRISEPEHTSLTVKTFTTGDYFGEQALVAPDCIRSADIIAVTDLACYQFQRQDFNWLLAGTPVVAKIERMIMARQDAVWDLMGMNSVLQLLSPTQKTQLEQRCRPKFFKKGEEVWIEGEEASVAVLIDSGTFKFQKRRQSGRRRAPSVFRHLGPPPPPAFYAGAFVGEIDALLETKPLQTTLVASEEGQVMIITKEDLLEFFTNAPGVLLTMLHTQFIMPCKEAVERKKVEDEEKELEAAKTNGLGLTTSTLAGLDKEGEEKPAINNSMSMKSEVWNCNDDDDDADEEEESSPR